MIMDTISSRLERKDGFDQSDIAVSLRKELTRQHYRMVGGHSACKVCLWTRKAILNKGVCYKQKWYGIESHRCMRMTPNITCGQRCVFCWRIIERTALPKRLKFDEPENIVDGCIAAQRKLLNGYPGHAGTDMKKFRQAQDPTNAAISLTGEPSLYPRLSELIVEFHRRKMTTFLVTNGQHPDVLESLTEPTQLYISVDAPDKPTLKRLDRPGHPDYWERLNKSLDTMSSMGKCRKVLRLTLVKGMNMKNPAGYAKLIEKADPDFIEAKAYMHVGESQKRLPIEAMPSHQDVEDFASSLAEESGFSVKDKFKPSRVVLLSRK
jgi:tRNA wybutosine-synthesizing protein 1